MAFTRMRVYKSLLKTLKTGKIKSFLLENVPRLVSDNSGMSVDIIESQIASITIH